MISIKEYLQAELETLGTPVYYEAFIGTDIEIPAISYMTLNDTDLLVGDTLEYSDKTVQIKVWDKRLSNLETLVVGIDALMKDIGFRREFATERMVDGVINKVMRYRCITRNSR